MRKILVLSCLVLMVLCLTTAMLAEGKTTVDPNVGGQVIASNETDTDARLEQTVTYRVKLRPIADLTDDLTTLTGITFFSGRDKSDWRVCEDCTTVMAKEVRLGSLMDSIAHVMKFKWLRRGKSPNWTYRLVEDDAAIAEVNRHVAEQKERETKERREQWGRLQKIVGMSPQELDEIKESDPKLYLGAKTGSLASTVGILQQVPELRNAWIAGEDYSVAASWLSESTRGLLKSIVRAHVDVCTRWAPDYQGSVDYGKTVLADLDNVQRTMTVSVWKSRPWATASSLHIQWPNGMAYATLDTPRRESQRLRERVGLRAYEEQRPVGDVFAEMAGQIHAAQAKEQPKVWIGSYAQEPLVDHPDDPVLAVPLKKRVAPKTITGLIADLADASGFAVVTDDYRGRTGVVFEEGSEFRKALDTIGELYRNANWNRNDRIIGLWDVNWFDDREARVSKVWLEELRRKLRESGTLDIDDLAEIAALSWPQMNRSVFTDEVLKCVEAQVRRRSDWLKLYAGLTSAQRHILLSPTGLAYTDLSEDQQRATIKVFLGLNAQFLQGLDLSAVGARVMCSKEKRGKQFIYTIKARTNLGDFPDQCIFTTPLYSPPPTAETVAR